MNKITISVISVLIAAAIVGAYFYPQVPQSFGAVVTGATTANTARIAQTTLLLSSSAATSTSILNTDAQDRYIVNAEVFCSGMAATSTGQASNLTFVIATSSTAGIAGANSIVISPALTATPPAEFYATQTTINTADFRRWAAGSYLTFLATATSSASCTPDVNYRQGLGV